MKGEKNKCDKNEYCSKPHTHFRSNAYILNILKRLIVMNFIYAGKK